MIVEKVQRGSVATLDLFESRQRLLLVLSEIRIKREELHFKATSKL
jgi:hypothetical protein